MATPSGDTPKARTRPKGPRKKSGMQVTLIDVQPEGIPEIEELMSEVYELQSQRIELQKQETEKRGLLAAAMAKHKKLKYKCKNDDNVQLEATLEVETTEKAYVKQAKKSKDDE